MAFVPGYKYDVFVSYAELDDLHQLCVDRGWISIFAEELKIGLARTSGCKDVSLCIDRELASHVKITENVIENLRNTATLIVILSSNYIFLNRR